MPIPAERTIRPQQTRNFGRFGDAIDVPPLTEVQTKSYERFLQLDIPQDKFGLYDIGGLRLAGKVRLD